MDEIDLSQLASEWWKSRRPGGYFRNPAAFSDEQADQVMANEALIDRIGENPLLLGSLLEALVSSAPPEELAYIGTWHLENAYPKLRGEVFAILEQTRLSRQQKDDIRSGFVWFNEDE